MTAARHFTCALVLAALVLLCPGESRSLDSDVATRAGTSSGGSGRSLVIGKVSDNPKKHYSYLRPMADYVAARMGDLGITEAGVLMAPSNDVMVRYLKEGRVDWVTETPFSSIIFREEAGAELLLCKWKKGVSRYRTVFFTRNDSDIHSIEDLRGRTIAFEDPGSSSAYFIPASELIEAGLKLVPLDSPRDRPPTDAVGYIFTHEEINSSIWVHRGIADAAAFNNLDWSKEGHMPGPLREELRIFHESASFPRALELVRGDLEPEIRERLREILLGAHEDPDAATALEAYQRTTRFNEIDAHVQTELREVDRLLHLVQSELGK